MLKGKVALVTGGSRGIGAAIALRLAKAGADVAILYAGNSQAAQATCADIEAQGVRALRILNHDAGKCHPLGLFALPADAGKAPTRPLLPFLRQ